MKILFYLPVVTPWWFDTIIVPMLRALALEAEVHVMVAPLWRNTGVDPDQLSPLADLDAVQWHIIHGDEHPLFRTDGLKVAGLLDRVAAIRPDLTLCRSADFGTPARFPGTIRYIMEGAAAPFETDPRYIILDKTPFTQGVLPPMDRAMRDACVAAITPAWARAMDQFDEADRQDWRQRLHLQSDRPVLAVPLHYEHEENFFLAHAAIGDSLALIDTLLESIDTPVLLAIADHPLNRRHVDRSALIERIDAQPDRLMLAEADDYPGGATALLARHADGMVQDLSKVWSLAAFFGTPLLRMGVAPSAPWLGANTDVRRFHKAMAQGQVSRPDSGHAMTWFGWHLGTRLLNPAAPGLTLGRLMELVHGEYDADSIAPRIAALIGQELQAA